MRKWAGEEGDDFCRENTQPACFSEKPLPAEANGDLDEGGDGKTGVCASEKIGAYRMDVSQAERISSKAPEYVEGGCKKLKHADIFKDLPTLETERLILRKVNPDDAEDVFA